MAHRAEPLDVLLLSRESKRRDEVPALTPTSGWVMQEE